MKNITHLFFILISLISLSTFAQTSNKTLNYQAVILDPNAIDIPGASITGQPLNKGKVCLRFSLLNAQGGLDYEETQQVTTDEFGLVSVAIGAGSQALASNSTSIYKSFESIQWNANVKSLKVSVSYDGCNSFKQVSTQIFNYTPYALYAEAVDYKNVRDAPTKLSQFSNDAGFLIPKDLDPLKTDIQANSSKIATANQNIADNKQASDAAFLVVNQSLTSLDEKVAGNTSSITNINTKLTEQQNQIVDNRNQIAATNNTMNAQIGGLQGQLNITNSTVSNLSGVAEMQSNKSTATNLGGANPSDQAYPSQKAAKAYIDNAIYDAVGSGVPDATTLAAGKVKLSGDLGGTAMSPTVPALATKENTANKSVNVLADGTNDTKYPSVKAVKDYVDQATLGTALAADLANKANILSPTFTGVPTAPTPASSDNSTKIATTAFVQAATAGIALQASVDAKADKLSPTFTGTPTAPTPTLGDNSTKLATTAYVDAQVSAGAADATTSTRGIVQLTGDLGGTATSPTVPGLALKANTADVTTSLSTKEDISNKSNAALGTSTTLYPTQSAVKTYVDAQVSSATIVDADATTRGKIQLAGDLGGTASSPTVPGLALKANTSDVTTSLATKEDASNKSNSALGTSTTLFPTQNAVKTYVDAQFTSATIADADATTKGKIQLTGDLAGSATSPSVVKLHGTPISSVAPTTAGHVLTYDVNGSATWAAPANSANTISGVVPVANGGTGLSSVTNGGAVYASSSSALTTGTLPLTAGGTGVTSQQAAINILTGTQTSGSYLRSDGTDARLSTIQAADVPTLNQNTTGNAANVTGTVAVANGGTGLKTLTANNVLLGNGSSALQAVAPGTSGNVLTSDGTTWTSAARGVPYSGASGAVDLGAYDLTVNGVRVGKGVGNGTTNSESTALGEGALVNSSNTGNNNTALGYRTLYSNTIGSNNTVMGGVASYLNLGGSNNVAIGSAALYYNTASGSNVAVGKSAGQYMTGGNNTALGAYTDMGTATFTNSTALGYFARVGASNTIQLGADGSSYLVNGNTVSTTAISNVKTSGTLTLKDVTYPNTHGSANQVLSTTGSGTLTWTTPSTTATAYSGTLPIANGGTNSTATATSGGIGYGTGTAHAYTSAGSSGQVLISEGAGTPTWATLTAGTAITITNTAGAITIAAAVRPMTEQVTATSSHAVATATFTLGNSPLNTKVWMFINGVRTNNNAYTVSGTTVTYTAANNNSYTIVAGDRIQFDYAY